jgi:RND family efflux transporter MFP subunit
MKKLHQAGKAVSRSGLDATEQQYNNRADLADQMAEAIDLYPLRIKEAESRLEAAAARLTLAETRLARCVVKAPFKARVKQVSLEVGQYVNPGPGVVTLSDDSILEIQVPIDSRDARQWLVFKPGASSAGNAWFKKLMPANCTIRWTEDKDHHFWEGRIDRVVAFNKNNRTLTVAVRVEGQNAWSENDSSLPLVEGMFCSVEIPGKTLKNVFRLPRWAVSFEHTVYLADNGRLRTIPVTVARIQGEEAIVSDGIQVDDRIITTRLVDPLENSLLEITE